LFENIYLPTWLIDSSYPNMLTFRYLKFQTTKGTENFTETLRQAQEKPCKWRLAFASPGRNPGCKRPTGRIPHGNKIEGKRKDMPQSGGLSGLAAFLPRYTGLREILRAPSWFATKQFSMRDEASCVKRGLYFFFHPADIGIAGVNQPGRYIYINFRREVLSKIEVGHPVAWVSYLDLIKISCTNPLSKNLVRNSVQPWADAFNRKSY
jgi:hypothetical protein